MKKLAYCIVLLLVAASSPLPAEAQEALRPSDLSGWWSADPVQGGESSHLALHFVEKDGKQIALLSVPAIGVYDYSFGEVELTGNSIETKGESFPLTWNPTTRTLSGHIPADTAPVYNIPIEFKRGEPLEQPPANEWQAPRPKIVWSVDTGAPVWAGIERAKDGTLFVATEAGVLNAISRDGKILWKFEKGKPIRAQPTLVGSHVYLASDSGFLYKLDRKTGAEVWRARVDTVNDPRLPGNHPKTRWDRYGSSVVADSKRLYIASRDKHLYALDMKSGREVWKMEAGDIMTATPALHGGNVIFAAYDGKVRAVSARDGTSRWTYDSKLAIAGDVTVSGDRVLVGSRSYDLIALDAATGRELWKHYYWFSWIESPPVVRDGVVYTGSSDATNVYAINLADGSLRWKTAVPGYTWQRTAVTEHLLVTGTLGRGAFPGSRAGSLLALDRATGAIRWIYLDPPSAEAVKAGKNWGFAASPVIADGLVYAADFNGKVYAFALD